MSETIKIIHTCNHVVEETSFYEFSKEITRSSLVYDIVDPNVFIKEISDVTKEDGITIYPSGTYSLYSHNKIAWESAYQPDEGDKYVVYGKSYESIDVQYSDTECPRCAGNGWYVGVIDSDKNKLNKNTDLQKLAQDFIKMLLTKTANKEVGTDLLNIIGSTHSSSSGLENEIVNCVYETESKCKKAQSDVVSFGGEISSKERLESVSVLSIEVSPDSTSAYVAISILNEYGSQISIGVDIN